MRNKKVIYALITIPLILASFFIGFVSNDVILPEEDPSSKIDSLTGTPAYVYPQSDSGSGSTTTPYYPETTSEYQQTIPEPSQEQWQEGETVKVEYHYPLGYILTETVSLACWAIPTPWDTRFRTPPTGKGFWFDATGPTEEEVWLRATWDLKTVVPGIIHYTIHFYKKGSGGLYASDTYSSTWKVDKDHIDFNGITNFYWYAQIIAISGMNLQVLSARNASDGSLTAIKSRSPTLISTTDLVYVFGDITCWHEPDPETLYPRFSYRTVSPENTELRLVLQSPAFGTEFRIFTDYDLTYVIEDCEISWISNYWKLTDTIGFIDYHIFFSSLHSFFLAIDDVTGNYLQNIGFEGEWREDWVNGASETSEVNVMDSVTLNSTIVSEGSYSVRLTSGTGGSEYDFSNNPSVLPDGEYYISFDFYKETSGVTWLIYYYDGSWHPNTINAETDRWGSHFFYFHIKGKYQGNRNLIFLTVTASKTCFIDNFRISQVNHQHEVIDYSQTLISGQLNSWTQFGLIPVSNHHIYASLRSRTIQEIIKTWELFTYYNGYFELIFEGKLNQEEYLLQFAAQNSIQLDSQFNSALELYLKLDEGSGSDVLDSSDNSISITETSIADSTWESGLFINSLHFDGSNDYLTCDLSSVMNLTQGTVTAWFNADSFANYMRIFDHVNGGGPDTRIYLGFYSSKIWYRIGDLGDTRTGTTTLSTGEWYFAAITWNSGTCRLFLNGEQERSDSYGNMNTFTSTWRIGASSSASDKMDGYIDDLRAYSSELSQSEIQNIMYLTSPKSYFTPISVTDYPYYYDEENENLIDCSEGLEGYETSHYWQDGYVGKIYDHAYGGCNIEGDEWNDLYGSNIISSYYTHLVIHFYSNVSGTYRMQFNFEAGGNDIVYFTVIANQWTYAERSLDTITNTLLEDDDSAMIQIIAHNIPGWKDMRLDHLLIVHRDSNLEPGYAYEFNEDSFKESWEYTGEPGSTSVENGYITRFTNPGYTCPRIATQIENDTLNSFNYILLRLKTDYSGSHPVQIYKSGGVYYYQSASLDFSDWQTLVIPIDWTFIEGWLVIRPMYAINDNWYLDYVRLAYSTPPNLYETDTDFLLDNEGFLDYITFTDNKFSGYSANGDFIEKNLTTGSHSFMYSAYYDYLRFGVTLPSAFYKYDYQTNGTGVMKIIIHDQSGNVIPFDSFKVYIDSTRLYDNYLYFLDISQTVNLTITDLFDNMLYQDTTEAFEQFKEIQLTLHSVKVQNLQENPIWLVITRASKTFSEWVYPYEIVKYRLEAATYSFKVYYCDPLAADLGAFSTNGSWINFDYAVSSDSALMVTGNTIQDVFANVISLTNDLDSVNTSMHIAFEDQTQNFTLQFTATNQNITFVLGNSSLIIETLTSNFTAILGDLILLDSNINGNFTTTFLAIAGNTTLLVNQLNSNFTDMQGLIISNNTVLYAQTVQTLEKIAEIQGVYRVHFSVIDGAGIGLPFETVLLNVNDSRQFDQDVYMSNNTYFGTEAFDWFDVSLWSDSFTITKQTEVNISVQLYWVLFENNGSYTSYLEIWRNNKLGVNITVAPDQIVSIRLTEGVYDYRVYYFKNDSQQTDEKDPSIYSYGKSLLKIGKFAVSAVMPTKIGVSTPKIKKPLIEEIVEKLTLAQIIVQVILTICGLTAAYFITNFLIRRALGRHAQDPSYVPPREREDWLDKLESRAGIKTDNKGLW